MRRGVRLASASASAMLALVLALASVPVHASTPASTSAATSAGGVAAAAGDATAWIVARQTASGVFFSADQSADMLAETVAALVSAGAARPPIDRALSALRKIGPARATRPAYAGRIVGGLVAAGENPRTFGGVDYVGRISVGYNSATGAYETGLYADALAVLGLVAAHAPIPAQAITYLRLNECPGGGFGHDPGCRPSADTDTTALVLAALIGAGVPQSDALVGHAIVWLLSARASDGTFPDRVGGTLNANSTGLALCGLATAKHSVRRDGLMSFRDPSGGFRYVRSDAQPNEYATAQSLPALVAATLPIRGRAVGAPAAVSNARSPGSGAGLGSGSVPAGHAGSSISPSVPPDSSNTSVVSRPVAQGVTTPSASANATPRPLGGSRTAASFLAAIIAIAAIAGGIALSKLIRRKVNGPRTP